MREFADRLRISSDRVYEALRSGHIKASRLYGDRGAYRIPSSELDRMWQGVSVFEARLSMPEESTRTANASVVEHLDAQTRFLHEAQREHLAEVRLLLEQFKDAVTTPQIDTYLECIGCNLTGHELACPTALLERNLLFNSIRDHLPEKLFWESFDGWRSKRIQYWDAREGFFWHLSAVVAEHMGKTRGEYLGLPILRRLQRTADGHTRFVIPYHFELLLEPGEIEEMELALVELDGSFHLEGSSLEAVRDAYEQVSALVLSTTETAELVVLYQECQTLGEEVRTRLTQALLSREYIIHRCNLCPLRD